MRPSFARLAGDVVFFGVTAIGYGAIIAVIIYYIWGAYFAAPYSP